MKLPERIRTIWGDLDPRTRLRAGYALIFLLVAALGWSMLAGQVAGLEKKRKAREIVLKELLPLKVAYRSARQSSDLLAGRMASLRPDDSLG
ncbi:MAG: hypothetical protein Q7V04_01330, partial [Deltaproteobacteria bacterium]|nr:hypothetical protein [Deltaproteobacteria bacterium]